MLILIDYKVVTYMHIHSYICIVYIHILQTFHKGTTEYISTLYICKYASWHFLSIYLFFDLLNFWSLAVVNNIAVNKHICEIILSNYYFYFL